MTHIRKQIRDAVKALLAGGTVPADQIYGGRAHPVDENKCPMWRVFTPQEISEPMEMGSPREVRRIVRVSLEAFAHGVDVEDQLDDLAVEAEVAMAADLTLGGLAKVLQLSGSDMSVNGEGRKTLGRLELTYDIETRTLDADPENPLQE
jgi:hypothetical protein